LLPPADVVVALTSPPLISVLAACLAGFWSSRFLYWVMDLNPDEAVAAGWMRAGSVTARLLERMSRFSLRRADRIIVPDRFMRERILSKGIGQDRLAMVAPWSQDDHVVYDLGGRKAFRKAHALERKFVVMYSGNHSPCHPLDTLLRAAQHLATDETITFCFIGGGSEWRGIQRAEHGLFRSPGNDAALQRRSALNGNVKCLGYQPLEQLKASLSAADLHVVILGDAMVGLVHPCKLYNILKVGAPILFIGPEPSHVSEILHRLSSEHAWCRAGHGDVVRVVDFIQLLSAATSEQPLRPVPELLGSEFSKRVLLPRLVAELEGQTPEGQKRSISCRAKATCPSSGAGSHESR